MQFCSLFLAGKGNGKRVKAWWAEAVIPCLVPVPAQDQ